QRHSSFEDQTHPTRRLRRHSVTRTRFHKSNAAPIDILSTRNHNYILNKLKDFLSIRRVERKMHLPRPLLFFVGLFSCLVAHAAPNVQSSTQSSFKQNDVF